MELTRVVGTMEMALADGGETSVLTVATHEVDPETVEAHAHDHTHRRVSSTKFAAHLHHHLHLNDEEADAELNGHTHARAHAHPRAARPRAGVPARANRRPPAPGRLAEPAEPAR